MAVVADRYPSYRVFRPQRHCEAHVRWYRAEATPSSNYRPHPHFSALRPIVAGRGCFGPFPNELGLAMTLGKDSQ